MNGGLYSICDFDAVSKREQALSACMRCSRWSAEHCGAGTLTFQTRRLQRPSFLLEPRKVELECQHSSGPHARPHKLLHCRLRYRDIMLAYEQLRARQTALRTC